MWQTLTPTVTGLPPTQVFAATLKDWVRIISEEAEMLQAAAAWSHTALEWLGWCKQRLTDFSLGLMTQPQFRAAVASDSSTSTNTAFELVAITRAWLHKKLIVANNPGWKQGLLQGSNIIPLWREDADAARRLEAEQGGGRGAFDCLVLEPFQEHWDPAGLIDGAGGRRISAAVTGLAGWAAAPERDTHRQNALLAELRRCLFGAGYRRSSFVVLLLPLPWALRAMAQQTECGGRRRAGLRSSSSACWHRPGRRSSNKSTAFSPLSAGARSPSKRPHPHPATAC